MIRGILWMVSLLLPSVSICQNSIVEYQTDLAIERKIDSLVAKMSLKEKIGQTALRGTSSREKGLSDDLKQAVRNGEVGAFLNVMDIENVDALQKIAVEESPHGIPLIFARDVIHGFKTIFPIPLGQAASWNEEIVRKGSRIAAYEATANGIRWTFAPMLDIARDSRWGRIAESPGEDPYLASVLARAYVEGFQGEDLSDPTSMAACAKHFMGYGAAIGGRDYNSASIHDALLYNVYIPPFAAALDAGAATVMSSFNELNGVPVSGSRRLLYELLRKELNFDGFVVSDWDSVVEMIEHGYAIDERHAAERAANAGLDMEMTSTTYEEYLEELIYEGIVPETMLDFYVKNILRIKFRLGLFERPYRPKEHTGDLYAAAHLEAAERAAVESTVLLKNNNRLLPLKDKQRIAVIGPLAHAPHEQLGTWTFDGEKEHTVTPVMAFEEAGLSVEYVPGLAYSRDTSMAQFKEALAIAAAADVVVFIGGEEAILSGEAHSRADISLPGAQEELIAQLHQTGKPVALVIMAGRPISLTNCIDQLDAVLTMWHPGTMGGPALYKMLTGKAEPTGRLPVTWPKMAGQLPLYYNHKNTGRPATSNSFIHIDDIPVGAWQSSLGNTSHYLDAGYEPHFPFGYGLGYTEFEYDRLLVSDSLLTEGGTITVSADITNTGERKGTEVVQFYVQDLTGRLTRPVKELKNFEKITVGAGETKRVIFTIKKEDLIYADNEGEKTVEPGAFRVWIGPDAQRGLEGTFSLE